MKTKITITLGFLSIFYSNAQSTKDVATHFFIDYLPKGNYVLEYDLIANQSGSFSNGITELQSVYAPEFSSHSSGERIIIKHH